MYTYSNYEIAMVAARCSSKLELYEVFWKIIQLHGEFEGIINMEFARKVFHKRDNYLTKNV